MRNELAFILTLCYTKRKNIGCLFVCILFVVMVEDILLTFYRKYYIGNTAAGAQTRKCVTQA